MCILYTLQEIEERLKNPSLIEYCQYLAKKYEETNEGSYRIKYNLLYPLLYSPLSDEKKIEFFNDFIKL